MLWCLYIVYILWPCFKQRKPEKTSAAASVPDYISHHPQRVASMRSVVRVSLIQLSAAKTVWMAGVCVFQFLIINAVFSGRLRSRASAALCARAAAWCLCDYLHALVEEMRQSGWVWKAPWWCCLSETVPLGSAVIQLNLDKWSCASGILHPDCSRFLKAMSVYCILRPCKDFL